VGGADLGLDQNIFHDLSPVGWPRAGG
jgi:hypothetical protein